MKIILPVAVVAVLLLVLSGTLSKLSVVDRLPLLLGLFLSAAIAVGVQDAWSLKRRVLGWIVSLALAVVGGLIGNQVGGILMSLPFVFIPEPPALSGMLGLLFFSVGGMLATLFGASLALRLVRSLRQSQQHPLS
jgi:drug/metabolite transporter (DMT)-like permease